MRGLYTSPAFRVRIIHFSGIHILFYSAWHVSSVAKVIFSTHFFIRWANSSHCLNRIHDFLLINEVHWSPSQSLSFIMYCSSSLCTSLLLHIWLFNYLYSTLSNNYYVYSMHEYILFSICTNTPHFFYTHRHSTPMHCTNSLLSTLVLHIYL